MDEKTQLLELPGWFQKMRQEHQAQHDDEPTVVVSEVLEAVTVRVEAVSGRAVRGPAEDDEATLTMPSLDAKTRPAIEVARAAEASRQRVEAVRATRQVRPWDRMRLASVTQAQARALGDFAEVVAGEGLGEEVLAGMAAAIGEGWRGVGSARVGVHWEDDATAFVGGASTWWRVMPGWERGLVWVDDTLARLWLGALELGHLGGEQAHGALCCVLGEVLGGAMRRCGWPQVSWGANPLPGRAKVELMRASRPPYVAWVLEVERGGVRGQIRLAMPWTLVRMVQGQLEAPAAETTRWLGLPAVGRFGVGRVGLTLDDVRGLGVGDVVLTSATIEPGEPKRLEAQVCFGARARWRGRLCAGEQGRWVFEVGKVQDEGQWKSGLGDGEPREDAMHEAAERAEVEVEVVVGEVRLELGQLSRLVVGQVLETGAPVGGAVRLMVGAQEVARGELVDVEGRLGVRVERVGG